MLFRELDLIVDSGPRSAALNMAVDEALLGTADRVVLRNYRWEREAVSFGYFECHEPVKAAYPERDLVRRWTGGGVVEHGRDCTYSLAVPESAAVFTSRAVYGGTHAAIAAVLKSAGIDAQLVDQPGPKQSAACFSNPVRQDVMAAGRKVAGAAQRRTRSGLLQQGSVQGVSLPDGFIQAVAERLAERVRILPAIPATVLMRARELAREKYATAGWMTIR